MHVFTTISELRNYLSEHRKKNKSIGFVPTMGSLHQGHLALVKRALSTNDVTVCSVYINPTQFNDAADFEKYPKDIDKDSKLLESVGCDALFCPSDKEVYPELTMLNINFGNLEKVLEGAHRSGHFNGVGTIVSKLFNIVQPDNAYFGQKDLQQFLIISRLVKDLSFPLTMHRVDTVREEDGLAMSSRNQRLTSIERKIAPNLHRALRLFGEKLKNGTPLGEAKSSALALLSKHEEIAVEYLEIVDTSDLSPITSFDTNKGIGIFIAAHLGKVRLIDNVLIEGIA